MGRRRARHLPVPSQSYTTGTTWTDRLGVRSVDSLVQDSINANPDASFRVVVLAKNQPPVDYPLTVTTSHRQQTDMQVGSTTPVGDTIHANNGGSSIKETLHGTAIVHYDGGPYTPTGSVSKPISFANSGDTVIDNLASPGDFGMDSWAEGTYWIDIQVPGREACRRPWTPRTGIRRRPGRSAPCRRPIRSKASRKASAPTE